MNFLQFVATIEVQSKHLHTYTKRLKLSIHITDMSLSEIRNVKSGILGNKRADHYKDMLCKEEFDCILNYGTEIYILNALTL